MASASLKDDAEPGPTLLSAPRTLQEAIEKCIMHVDAQKKDAVEEHESASSSSGFASDNSECSDNEAEDYKTKTAPIFVVVFLNTVSMSLFFPQLTAYILGAMHCSATTIGLQTAMANISSCMGLMMWQSIAKRFSLKHIIAVNCFMNAGVFVFFVYEPMLVADGMDLVTMMIGMRIIMAAFDCSSVISLALSILIEDDVARSRALGKLSGFCSCGMLAGQFASAAVSVRGWTFGDVTALSAAILFFNGLFSIACVPTTNLSIAMQGGAGSQSMASTLQEVKSLISEKRVFLMLMVCVCDVVSGCILASVVPVYLMHDFHFGPADFAFTSVVSSVITLTTGFVLVNALVSSLGSRLTLVTAHAVRIMAVLLAGSKYFRGYTPWLFIVIVQLSGDLSGPPTSSLVTGSVGLQHRGLFVKIGAAITYLILFVVPLASTLAYTVSPMSCWAGAIIVTGVAGFLLFRPELFSEPAFQDILDLDASEEAVITECAEEEIQSPKASPRASPRSRITSRRASRRESYASTRRGSMASVVASRRDSRRLSIGGFDLDLPGCGFELPMGVLNISGMHVLQIQQYIDTPDRVNAIEAVNRWKHHIKQTYRRHSTAVSDLRQSLIAQDDDEDDAPAMTRVRSKSLGTNTYRAPDLQRPRFTVPV